MHASFPSDTSAARRPPFPTPLTPCIGREAELAQLCEQLLDPACRLITVVGSGGLGKTRLVLELGGMLLREPQSAPYARDGIAFAALTSLTPAADLDELLATTIAEAAGYTFGGPHTPAVQLRRYLQGRSMLLVLDNLEQIPQAAPYIATLLREAPGLKVLATSRERLKLRGEHLFALQPLAYPGPESAGDSQYYSAVQLFVEAARSVTPDLVLDQRTQAAVLRICRLVEGLPLGLELAASWTRVLSCDEIADQLERNLGLLDATLQDLPARHHSLSAVFDASWQLLTPAEQRALRRLSVLRGSFGREMADAVADATLPLLLALVDKSLVRRLAGAGTSELRFSVPEVLRQFAAEQLRYAGEEAQTRAGYAQYMLEQTAAQAPQLRGAAQQGALTAMAAEIEHIRAAWSWAIENGEHDALRRSTDSLFLFYYMRSWFSEGAAMFGAARAALASRTTETMVPPVGSILLAREAWFTFQLGRQREAQELLEQSLASLRLYDDAAELVFPLNYLAAVCGFVGEYERTGELCRESLAITTAIDDRYGHAVAFNILGQAAFEQRQYEQARSWSQQSLAIEQQLGNRWSMAFSLTNLGKVAYVLRDFQSARRMIEESLAIRRAMGDARGEAISLNQLGDIAVAETGPAEAGGLYSRSLDLARETANPWGITAALINLGRLALAERRDATAARLLYEAQRLARETQAQPQLLAVLTACVPLLRRAGQPELAAELQRIVDTKPPDPAPYRPQLDRLSQRLEQIFASGQGTASLELAIQDLLAHAGAPPGAGAAPASAFPAGLTAREVDVLRLVAQGLTDKQVAEKLIVSPRTVTSHLTSIYGKLEVNTRAAATRFAVDNKLV